MEKKYQSKYTEHKVTEAQYLTDIACERIAKKEKEILPKHYWNLEKWRKHFRRQIVAANALLKEFTCKQIIDALNTYRGKNIYSLGLKKPISEIINNQKEMKAAPKVIQPHDEEIFDDWTDEEINYHGERFVQPKKESIWEKLQ